MCLLPDVFISDVVQPGLLSFRPNRVRSHLSSFTAQHSEPYVIAGLMNVLKDFVIQSRGNFPTAHYPEYFLPLHPPDYYPNVDISL